MRQPIWIRNEGKTALLILIICNRSQYLKAPEETRSNRDVHHPETPALVTIAVI